MFEDSSKFLPIIDDATLELFAMPLKWYTFFGNPSEKEEAVIKARIMINVSVTSTVLSATIEFQNGFCVNFDEKTPELLQILQKLLVQKNWSIPYDEKIQLLVL